VTGVSRGVEGVWSPIGIERGKLPVLVCVSTCVHAYGHFHVRAERKLRGMYGLYHVRLQGASSFLQKVP
jgi:hypothetical protein